MCIRDSPSNPLQDLVFRKFMYKQQARYEQQLRQLGILSDKEMCIRDRPRMCRGR